MTPDQLALIHAQCFTTAPRPWSASEIAEILSVNGTFLLIRPNGFLIGRSILDEAELLTLAVQPTAQRQGIGRALLLDFESAAAERGAARAFLEVSALNDGAMALYSGHAWEVAGRRRNYYAPGTDAVIMAKPLSKIE